MPFEAGNLQIKGHVTVTVLDPRSPGTFNLIIQIPDAWAVRVELFIQGDDVLIIPATAQWRVRVWLEAIGPGLEGEVGFLSEPVGHPSASHNYNWIINVPGNFPSLTPGVYKLTTLITLDEDGVSIPVVGVEEGPLLQFYQ